MSDVWELILEFYEKELKIPRKITDYLSVSDILKNCAMGLSNSRIAKSNELDDIEYITITVNYYLGFPGWKRDLDFSPLAIYNRSRGSFLIYEQEITMISTESFNGDIRISFDICKRYSEIKEEIDKYYG